MLLFLNEEQKDHLFFLKELDIDVLSEFCRISAEFIIKGVTNTKIYHSAAQKLETDVDTVKHGVEGLMNLFTEGAKQMLDDKGFRELVSPVNYSEATVEVILRHFRDNVSEIRAILSRMVADVPHYKSLEWRCEARVASRSLRHQVVPLVTLKLTTETKGETKSHLLQTDPANLVHLAETLEHALREIKSQHCRRIQRQIK